MFKLTLIINVSHRLLEYPAGPTFQMSRSMAAFSVLSFAKFVQILIPFKSFKFSAKIGFGRPRVVR